MNVQVITVEGVEYAILPKAELDRLAAGGADEGLVDALDYTRRLIAHDLLRAREAAGLTQRELAERVGVSRSMVAGAERGHQKVGARYVARVLKACGLPSNWRPSDRPSA
ncbi:MAG: helix-turn-helix domain-containing protein [Dehalococcoidia bacterium]